MGSWYSLPTTIPNRLVLAKLCQNIVGDLFLRHSVKKLTLPTLLSWLRRLSGNEVSLVRIKTSVKSNLSEAALNLCKGELKQRLIPRISTGLVPFSRVCTAKSRKAALQHLLLHSTHDAETQRRRVSCCLVTNEAYICLLRSGVTETGPVDSSEHKTVERRVPNTGHRAVDTRLWLTLTSLLAAGYWTGAESCKRHPLTAVSRSDHAHVCLTTSQIIYESLEQMTGSRCATDRGVLLSSWHIFSPGFFPSHVVYFSSSSLISSLAADVTEN